MITLDRINFDPSSATDPARVGAYLISNAGNVITDTGSALDVNLKTSDLFVTEDAAHTGPDSGPLIMGIRQDAGGSPVSADGDFHPFIFNNDGELKVAADLTSSVGDDDADSGNPIKIGGRAVDGLLTAISANNDRYDLLADMYRRTWVNTSPNVGYNVADADVTDSAAELASTPLAGRRIMTVQNLSNTDIYLGHSNAVTTSNGIMVPKNGSWSNEFGEDLDIYAIAGTAGPHDIRVEQIA